jgi:hypothetical protein
LLKRHNKSRELLEQTRFAWKKLHEIAPDSKFHFPRYPEGGPGLGPVFDTDPERKLAKSIRTMNPKDEQSNALKDELIVPPVKDDHISLNSDIQKRIGFTKSKAKSTDKETHSTTSSKVFSDIGNQMVDYFENEKKLTIVLLFNNIRYFTPITTILLLDTFMFMFLIIILFIIIPCSVELFQVSINLLLFLNFIGMSFFYCLIWCNRIRKVYNLYGKILNINNIRSLFFYCCIGIVACLLYFGFTYDPSFIVA